MTSVLRYFHRHEDSGTHCPAHIGANVACGRELVSGERLCSFHRTLAGAWFKAALR